MASVWKPTISREFLSDLSKLPAPVAAKALRTVNQMLGGDWASGLNAERVHNAEDGICSCRVDDAYRIIWKRVEPSEIIFCLVDKHDEAYRRAARKHFALKDGAIQVADILQVGAKIPESSSLLGWAQAKHGQPGTLFVGYRDKELLDLGVPKDVLPNVRALDDANQLPLLERLLPQETFDKLVGIALGIVDRPVVPAEQLRQSLVRYQGGEDLRRFLDSEEFKRALDGSLEEWMLFLAPQQTQLVFRTFSGPARIKGVVGSGKTVVAIHRTRNLARQAHEAGGKILFLTFGNRLPDVIRHLLRHLGGDNAPELQAVECATIHQWCSSYLAARGRPPHVDFDALWPTLQASIGEVRSQSQGLGLWSRPTDFFRDEIGYSIKGRAIANLNEYLALDRSGRGTALREPERRAVYAVYEAYQKCLKAQGCCDWDDFVLEALKSLEEDASPPRYSAAVVDEIQDLSEAIIRLVRKLVPPSPNDLFLVGDGLQRLYPGGYSLGRMGIDITGRSALLTRNYRNTHEILRAAHAMVAGAHFDDLDEGQSPVVEPEFSLRHGQIPVLHSFATGEEEVAWVAAEAAHLKRERNYQDRDLAVLYRFRYPYVDLLARHLRGQFKLVQLGKDAESYFGPGLKHTTFDSAKGLEFKVVFVLGVTDGRYVPRDDSTLDEVELQDYLAREQRRLYVAMTRARDLLYLSYSQGTPSRFLAGIPSQFLQRA